eukprot:9500733-Pyramimonas_sp.AAC.3
MDGALLHDTWRGRPQLGQAGSKASHSSSGVALGREGAAGTGIRARRGGVWQKDKTVKKKRGGSEARRRSETR